MSIIEMELKDLQSDLEALRELYGLTNCGKEVARNVILGERSKLLLKNLLDGATKKVLETHKKIMVAAEHGISGNSRSSESGKWKALLESQCSVSSNTLKAEPDVIGNFAKESNQPAFSSSKDEDSPNRLTTHEVILQQSRFTSSLDKPENGKKNCEFIKKSSMKQHDTSIMLSEDAKQQGRRRDPLGQFYQARGEEKNLLERNETNMKLFKSNETMRRNSIRGLRGTPSVVGSVTSSSNSVAPRNNVANLDGKQGEAVNNFSKDIDNVVKHIESHISALRLCSKLADATKATMPHDLSNLPTPVCPTVQANENLVADPFSDRNELQLIGQVGQRNGKKDDSNGSCHVLGQSMNDLLDDLTSKRRRIQHKDIDQTCKHIVRSDSRMNKKVGNWNVFGMLEEGGQKHNETTGCYVHGLRIPTKQSDITKRSSVPVKMPYPFPIDPGGKESSPNIAKFRPSLPSQSTGSKALSHKKRPAHEIVLEPNKGGVGILRNRILTHHQEPVESSTSGSASSDSEVYSSLNEDSSASISSRFDHGVHVENSSSTSSDYRNVGESGRLYPITTHKSIHPEYSEPEKAEGQKLGRLRRLKNKLGLIFHHHHHHHHHHRYDHQDNGAHTKSLWTPLHKLFHPRNRNEGNKDKLRKARASNVPVKHQAGHFHALVDGLMRHLRHSKKPKASKVGGMGWLGNNNQHKKNTKVKQSHWWQMFQRHGGVKLPNRRRIKVGFMSKKQQLKVPKFR